MAITTNLTINLEVNSPNDLVLIHAVQGEYYSRQVTANLYSNGEQYVIPSEAIALIRYRKPDASIGFYDFDPAGNRIVNIPTAGTYANKQVIFTIAPEMCDTPGRVFAHIDLYSKSSGNRLSAFYFEVNVEKAATDPEIYKKANVSGVQDLLKDIIGSVYTPSEDPQEGAIIDNTLSIPGAVGDAKAMGDVVLVQDDEPNTEEQPTNKLWIDSNSLEEGTEVPEMDDIVSEFNSSETYYTGDYVYYDGHFYKYVAVDSSSGIWDDSKWEQITIFDEINGAVNIANWAIKKYTGTWPGNVVNLPGNVYISGLGSSFVNNETDLNILGTNFIWALRSNSTYILRKYGVGNVDKRYEFMRLGEPIYWTGYSLTNTENVVWSFSYVDDTLQEQTRPAQSKAVGNAIKNLQNKDTDIYNWVKTSERTWNFCTKGYVTDSGTYNTSSTRHCYLLPEVDSSGMSVYREVIEDKLLIISPPGYKIMVSIGDGRSAAYFLFNTEYVSSYIIDRNKIIEDYNVPENLQKIWYRVSVCRDDLGVLDLSVDQQTEELVGEDIIAIVSGVKELYLNNEDRRPDHFKPLYVCLGTSLDVGEIHRQGESTVITDYKTPDYFAALEGLELVNLASGGTGIVARGTTGKKNNFMEQIIENADLISKANLVTIHWGANDLSALHTPGRSYSQMCGLYTDFFEFATYSDGVFTIKTEYEKNSSGINTQLYSEATEMGALNWCIWAIYLLNPRAIVVSVHGESDARYLPVTIGEATDPNLPNNKTLNFTTLDSTTWTMSCRTQHNLLAEAIQLPHIDFSDGSFLTSWNNQSDDDNGVLGYDGVHYTNAGYLMRARYISGQLRKILAH